VTVRHTDLAGGGHLDLVLIYSQLSHTHFNSPGAPADLSREYMAKRAVLRVINPDGVSTSTVLRGGPGAAALLGIARVGNGVDKKIFIQVNQISSGSTASVYSLYHHRLVLGGYLSYGGDSGVQAGFGCLPHGRLIQRVFTPLGNLLSAPWNETDTTFQWRGPRLVKITTRTSKHHGPPAHRDITAGTGCFKQAANHRSS
jgi:hypothetical protein